MKFKKIYWIIIICSIMAAVITFFTNDNSFLKATIINDVNFEDSIIHQKLEKSSGVSHIVTKLYYKGELVAYINDKTKIEDHLNNKYHKDYEVDYPNSSLALSPDLYYAEESSYFYYDDVDDVIVNYIENNSLYSIEATRIGFSNGAILYVKSMDDFNEAKDKYLLNYIDKESLNLISNNMLPEELKTYGERPLDIQVAETYSITKGFAPINDVKKTVADIVEFLCYGYGVEKKYYTTLKYDTIEWVANQAHLTTEQLIALNPDILKTANQVLAEGTVLNITYFNSPITVIVTKERIAKEVVYAEGTIYRSNSSIREGVNNIIVEEQNGSKNVYYTETYTNGILTDQVINKSVVTLEPVREVVEYGTKIIPGIGSGKFRYPVNNWKITCRWMCYNNPAYGGVHRGTDFIDSVNRNGKVYAADRGTISKVGYDSISGHYVIIDHNNGYTSYYGHMKKPCIYNVGVNVNKGDVIGDIGMTGQATGYHVHFYITYNGVRYDPCKFLGC